MTKIKCLSAFETFIKGSTDVTALEMEMNQKPIVNTPKETKSEQNIQEEEKSSKKTQVIKPEENKTQICIDPTIRIIRNDITKTIDRLCNGSTIPVSPLTLISAGIGAGLGALPGYGTGYVIGYALGQTNGAVDPKLSVTNVTNYAMKVILGGAGKYLGYFASNMLVDATLERAFAKVFEAIFALLGAGAAGTVGLVIFDFTIPTLMNLCHLYDYLNENLPHDYARNADPKFIQGLLTSEPEVFSDANKEHVQRITKGMSLFTPPVQKSVKSLTEITVVEDNLVSSTPSLVSVN
jgi:hypothetical protein